MENSDFFSVIVPVYKVEKYLRQCVDSVLSQEFKAFELILVDDGSPDACPEICDEYARMDTRVKVIHKANGGASSARNAGIGAADGQYICFMDADDYWFDGHTLDKLFDVISMHPWDVVLLRNVTLYETTGKLDRSVRTLPQELYDERPSDDMLRLMIEYQIYCSCPWDKVVRRELFEKNDLQFSVGILGEDVDWTARLAIALESIVMLPEPVYVHRRGRPGSLTDGLTNKNLLDTKDSLERCLRYIEQVKKSEVFRRAYYNFLAFRYVIWMAENGVLEGMKKTQLSEDMKKKDWLLKYDDNKKVRLVRKVRQAVGWHAASFLLGGYLKIRKA